MKQGLSLLEWTEQLQAQGKISFTLQEVKDAFPDHSDGAIKLALNRLSKKDKVLSVHKGYYLIIPPQYASRGILPPALYLDGLMKFLKRDYYVGLLNAASFHGAAHQQPQEFFVFTTFPVLRPTLKKGIKVNYISKKNIPGDLLEGRKTETGTLKISSPEFTAADLVQFEKRIGGISRASTVLNELADEMKEEKINLSFIKEIPITTLQRLGYLLEKILHKENLAKQVFDRCSAEGLVFFRIPLKTSSPAKGFPFDAKWKIIINTEIEIDE